MLVFVRFISNFLCMCSNSMASAHVMLKQIRQSFKGGCESGRKVVPHNSNSELPLGKKIHIPLILASVVAAGKSFKNPPQ